MIDEKKVKKPARSSRRTNETSAHSVTAVTESSRDYALAISAEESPRRGDAHAACGSGRLVFWGAVDELREIWMHPDHKDDDDRWHHPKPKG